MNTQKLINKSRHLINIPNSRYKHFTFILSKNNKIVSIGINNIKKTHPLAKKYNHRFYSTHSEISALAKFPYPLKTLPLYNIINIRLNKKGELRLAKPCNHCQALLQAFGVKQIYYSTSNNTFEHILLNGI